MFFLNRFFFKRYKDAEKFGRKKEAISD